MNRCWLKMSFAIFVFCVYSASMMSPHVRAQITLDSVSAAATFCNGTDIQTRTRCDWADEIEQGRTAGGAYAGTLWMAEPKPPKQLQNARSYYQIAAKVVSLKCKGRLTARAVFKLLPQSRGCIRLLLDGTTLGSYGRAASPTTRCQLRIVGPDATVANGTDATAVQTALAAPETACQTCTRCESCPADIGVWYSDTASFTYDGCGGVAARPRDPYTASMPGVVVNPGVQALLAGFTVTQAAG